MFTKGQFFIGMGITLAAGVAIGYSKAREKFLEALLKATGSNEGTKDEEAE